MAKRYHGEKKYSHDMAVRHREGGMISDDHSQPCLLPKEIKDIDWPKEEGYMNGHAPTLFRGEQEMLRKDREDYRREYKPKKW